MQYIKDITNEIGKLTNLYGKLRDFNDFEDLEELSDLMGTNIAIENVKYCTQKSTSFYY